MTTFSPSLWVVRWLKAQSSGTLDKFSGTHVKFGRMIYRDEVPFPLQGTGARAVTVTTTPGPASPFTTHAYSTFCSVRLYADHDRDGDGIATVENGSDKAWEGFGALDHLLYAAKPLRLAGETATVQCDRGGPPAEFYDRDVDLPYVAVNYDVAVLASI